MERKSSILVRVKESDKAVRLRLRRSEVALITEEVEDFEGADEGVAISVKSLEGRVRGEVADGAKTLTGDLKALLTVANSHDKILQSTLRFVTKTHVCCNILAERRELVKVMKIECISRGQVGR